VITVNIGKMLDKLLAKLIARGDFTPQAGRESRDVIAPIHSKAPAGSFIITGVPLDDARQETAIGAPQTHSVSGLLAQGASRCIVRAV
jgi:hypothetical protein